MICDTEGNSYHVAKVLDDILCMCIDMLCMLLDIASLSNGKKCI
jgi:hypothetical protein